MLPVHASLVQGFPSSHWALVVQQPAIGVRTHNPTGALSDALNPGPFVNVPFWAGVVESAALVPPFSLSPQRPMRLVAEVISRFLPAWISARVRARFQTRASSNKPPKNPAVDPVEVIAVPRPKCWMLS